jgi:hypothetical protein
MQKRPAPRHPLVATYATASPTRALRWWATPRSACTRSPPGYNLACTASSAGCALRPRVNRARPGRCRPAAALGRRHRRTTLPIYLGTNAIVRLFTDDRAPARAARTAVLRLASGIAPLKSAITRQLTGRPAAARAGG